MKKILITGANSYIGKSFENYLKKWPDCYQVDAISLRDSSWTQKSFAGYDVVFHVAGIAHSDHGKISQERAQLYYNVNTRLTLDVARKAKAEGVKQFIFMSSAAVYGEGAPIGKDRVITRDTPIAPVDVYGDSKAMAERGILPLQNENYNVVVLRPPMIYGKGCKGNYATLTKIARLLPVFPYISNRRSMLYIGNLVEFIRLIVDNEERGIFWPQNKEYTNTTEMVRMIARAQNKPVFILKGFTWALRLMGLFTKLADKAFGSLRYDQELSRYKQEYCLVDLETSIRETECD